MKKVYITFLALLAFTFCKAQYVTIPDTTFVKWLQADPDLSGCMNGSQLDTTCKAVLNKKTIIIYIQNLTNLSGIQYFKNLDTLICGGNQISILPSLPSDLTFLSVNDNDLTTLPILPSSLTYLNCPNNKFTTLSGLPSSLTYLDCSYNFSLTSISALQSSLTYLNCSENPYLILTTLPSSIRQLNCSNDFLITLPALPTNLKSLDCSNNNLTNLPALPSLLNTLLCNNNKLSGLPPLPTSLNYLNCQSNQITILPSLPDSINTLYCASNLLTSVPSLPLYLLAFECDINNITALPPLPNYLFNLSCSYNQITALPTLPASMVYLICNNNQLTALPVLPPLMNQLICKINQISSLPQLPSSLYYLDCSQNQLTTLPPLDSGLNYLACNNNSIISIPVLPFYLHDLECENNKLVSLPNLPDSLNSLNSADNQLTSLPSLPYAMCELQVDSNPLLNCLPPLAIISGELFGMNSFIFDISGTGISCLPNVIQHPDGPSYPAIDTMPLCGIFNPHGCAVLWNITGQVFSDIGGNCDSISLQPPMGNTKVLLFDSTGVNLLQQVITNGNGSYSFNTKVGNYVVKVDTAGTPFAVVCPDSSDALPCSVTAFDSLLYAVNLGLTCKPGYDLGVNSINYTNGLFFPGDAATVNIQAGDFATFFGVTCNTAGLAGTVQAVITGPANCYGTTGTYTASKVTSDTIIWTVTDFSNVDFTNSFGITLLTSLTAKAGDQVCVTVTINGNTGTDNNPSNNTLTQCFTVVTSHDPNFKEVYPSSTANAGEWLTYTVHFQNTGTAAAQNIYILDTIDNNLDISTIQILAESNNALIQVLPGRIVRFSFPNIFLPDSLDSKDSSIGYVQYKIKTISTITPNTFINNTASVYFDYNAPVQTNTAVCAFDFTGVKQLTMDNGQLTIYPNPTSGIVNVVMGKECNGCIITVTDLTGRIAPLNLPKGETLKSGANGKVLPLGEDLGGVLRLDFSGLASGIYFIRVSTATQTSTVKVVKE